MTRRLDKRGTGKLTAIIGVGGVTCPCCIWRTKAYAKLLWNRCSRRKETQELRRDLVNIQEDLADVLYPY